MRGSSRSRFLLVAPVALAVVASGLLGGAAAAAPRTLETGFLDEAILKTDNAERPVWLGRARGVAASNVRINLFWDQVAPAAPPAGAATDPAWAGYRFAQIDSAVRAAQAAGLEVMLNVSKAPVWAEGPGRPKKLTSLPGSWKPDPGAYGEFVTAVARRYSGTTQDPSAPGASLPRVRRFQLWNEPNLNLYLAPQHENGRPFAPGRWRDLLNTGYAAAKAVQPAATVVAGGLAPYGDPISDGAGRSRPVAFMRDALCLDDRLRRTCDASALMDVVSLHPYAVDRPSRHARDPDDATVPDFNRIATVVNAARREGTVGPKLPEYWVTEISYDSSGPDPDGVPLAQRARYISESMWRVWRIGVSNVIWYLVRDEAPTPSYAATYQSGIFYRSGRRKPDARAFRFPLMVTGKSASRLNVWFRTPTAGTTSVQIRRNGRWTTAVRKRGLPLNGVATVKVPRSGVTGVRGVAGKATSYVWDVG